MIPRIIGFSSLAISFKGLRLLWISKDLNFSKMLFFDFALTKVLGTTLLFSLNFTQLGRIVNPKKSYPLGYLFSAVPLTFTIRVLSGCKISLQAFQRYYNQVCHRYLVTSIDGCFLFRFGSAITTSLVP